MPINAAKLKTTSQSCEILFIKDISLISPKIISISKLKQPEQRTEEWYNMRYNMITASDAGSVIGTKLNDSLGNNRK